MSLTSLLVFFVSLWTPITASPQSPTATASEATPMPTICGDVITFANENLTENFLFRAVDAFDCLTSVPFHAEVANRYIDYYNTTIQFQSTLAYLKNPPEGYQQPAIDVLAALEQIKQNITDGYYTNQYDFEVTLQSLVARMHDSHVTLNAGILSAFSFGSPYDIVSLSVDGKQAPQIYLADDVIRSQQEGWTPSPVELINGANATQYLQEFAALNSEGSLEPNTDWNLLFYTPVQDILDTGNVFGWYTTFYPGDELIFTFANQSTLSTIWIAIYNNLQSTGPLTTGGDFYNYFVLGLIPASFVEPANEGDATSFGNDSFPSLLSWNEVSLAYPSNPFVVQKDLGVSGFVTGYFLDDSSTAVLSIPSFDAFGATAMDFSAAVGEFIASAKGNGTSRVVIDLQQNTGGAALMAYDTFLQFFPNIDPFGGSRRRSFPLEDTLGNAITNFWDSLTPGTALYDLYYDFLADDEWVVTDLLDAVTGQNFTSWQQLNGPVRVQDDDFSLIQRYNLSSDVFVAAALAAGDVFVDGNEPGDSAIPQWQPSEIILLTDGLCGSTCALFAEMMTHDAGVRSVVVGGTPSAGPMQAVSGSRGARSYLADLLDGDFELAKTYNSTANTTLPQVREQAIFTNNLGFNLRDQIRQGQDVPLQFQYEAANCRIYYTLANLLNLTQLWSDAARAMFEDNSLCVEGSLGSSLNDTNEKPQAPSYDTGSGSFTGILPTTRFNLSGDGSHDTGLTDDRVPKPTSFTPPGQDGECAIGSLSLKLQCSDSSIITTCAPSCSRTQGPYCGNGKGYCYTPPPNRSSREQTVSRTSMLVQRSIRTSFCRPLPERIFPGCEILQDTA